MGSMVLVCAQTTKTSNNAIQKDFANGKEKVNVIISSENKNVQVSHVSMKVNQEIKTQEINKEEYYLLLDDPNIKIEYNFKIKKLLQQSVPIIKANDSWSLITMGVNLTGRNQGVCIIDTGINYSHPDFGGCTSVGSGGNCRVVGGYDFGNDDSDPMDVDGHGTHVAGIVGANGGILGVAPNVNIIAVKVFDDAGNGYDSDIINGIDWCTNHIADYNISVISISLGLTDNRGNSILYSDYCDNDFSSLKISINRAVAQNISVVVASGNENSRDSVDVPACIQNATPITSTNKADTNISNFANTWNKSLLKILAAPGESINSTMLLTPSGDILSACGLGKYYCSLQGTSMATPHVAGAIAIINQYLSSIGQTKTPSQIEDLFNATGKQIYDSSANRFFSRIDVYSALKELDAITPNVTLSIPENNLVSTNINQTFICNTTDWQLKNITLYLWNSTEVYFTETKNISGTQNSTEFNVTDLPPKTYVWNCLASDEKGNSAFAINNFSLIVGGISLSLISPQNETYTNIVKTVFNCSTSTSADREIKNVTFFIYENLTLINTSTTNLTGVINSTTFDYTFVNETNYSWGCEVYSNESDYDIKNQVIYYDATYPNITLISETVSTDQATISWNTSEQTNYSISLNSISNSSFSNSFNVLITGLIASTTYEYNLTYCDRAGNCDLISRSFRTIDAPVSRSSGGGGGGGGVTTIKLNDTQISQGYSRKYYVGDKVSFDLDGQVHSMQLNKILNNTVNLTFRSEPIAVALTGGEEKKLNLTSIEFYNLYIKVENLTKSSANITIKQINELINQYKLIKYDNNTDENETNEEKQQETVSQLNLETNLYPLYATLLLLVIAFFYFLLKNKFQTKTKVKNKKK